MTNVHNRNIQRLQEHLRYVDELSLIVLKGHLILEEQLDRILSTLVFHSDHLLGANLRFVQKVSLARSVSLDEDNNPIWDLILAINTLRNELSHALESGRRQSRVERVKALYLNIYQEAISDERNHPDNEIVAYSIGLSLGFLGGFEEEIIRFKDWVDKLDIVVNPNRRKKRSPR